MCSDHVESPKPSGSICWSGPVVFPAAGNWHLTSPFDVDIPIALDSLTVCGRVSAFDVSAPRQVLLLNVNNPVVTFTLDRTGHVPADLGARSTALAPEIVRLGELRVPATGRGRARHVMRLTRTSW